MGKQTPSNRYQVTGLTIDGRVWVDQYGWNSDRRDCQQLRMSEARKLLLKTVNSPTYQRDPDTGIFQVKINMVPWKLRYRKPVSLFD
jgi:hypothetical protein